MNLERPACEHIEEAHRLVAQDRLRSNIKTREQHYVEAADVIENTTNADRDINEAAKKIVDPLLDLLNFVDTESKEAFPLRLLIGEVIELIVCFPGGYFTVFGRVSLIQATPCLWVGDCRLDTTVLVRRESCGPGFIFDSKDQD